MQTDIGRAALTLSDLINRDNSLNSISLSDCPDGQFNGLSYSMLHELRKSDTFRVIIGHINVILLLEQPM